MTIIADILPPERLAELRLDCLRLAVDREKQHGGYANAVETARAYADFVLGTNDAEILGAARELAAKVRG